MIAAQMIAMAISAIFTTICSLLLRCASLFKMSSVVFLGIVFEWPEIKHECAKAWKTIRRIEFVDSPPPPRAVIFGAFGWVLILFGIFGECWFEVKVNLDDNDIAYINNVILEKTGETTKDAQKSAELANRAANDAQASADAANDAAGEAQDSADAANASDKELKAALADTQSRLEKEQQNEAALQHVEEDFLMGRASGRFLEIDLSTRLRKLPPANAMVEYERRDDEACEFANVIQLSLVNAGWTVPEPTIFGLSHIPSGVTIYDTNAEVLNPDLFIEPRLRQEGVIDTSRLKHQLSKAGLKGTDIERISDLIVALGAVLIKDPSLPENTFEIVVGPMKDTQQNKQTGHTCIKAP